jgi:uncharacterized protein involved in high-affinity Fe2+ transport
MSFIIYPQTNGQVAVIIPGDPSLSIEEIAAKDVPTGLPCKIVDSLTIDDAYFNAYEFHPELGAAVNIEKAQAIHLDKFRAARGPFLAALDIDYSRADESGDAAKKSEIATKKQALRDVTKVGLPSDLPSLKDFWPSILGPRP